MNGFKQFILRGNIVDLAVAFVIGVAFAALVTALVTAIINPLIGAIFNADSLKNSLQVTLPGTNATLSFGVLIAAIINFILIALVVYFALVIPVAYAKKRFAKSPPPAEPVPTELELLTQIRDLLAGGETTTAAPATGKHANPAASVT